MAATGKTTPKHDAKIASMSFGAVYPHYVTKVVSKGRTEQELQTVIGWLTGIEEAGLRQAIDDELYFEAFFANVALNPKAALVKGVICGYRVEAIETPLTRQVRILDKLVDELARGRPIDKILRTG
ncbi:MAG: DUF2200 domain-containing protein [Pseudohongiellaceae bacterium]